jgi:hypothetical protein
MGPEGIWPQLWSAYRNGGATGGNDESGWLRLAYSRDCNKNQTFQPLAMPLWKEKIGDLRVTQNKQTVYVAIALREPTTDAQEIKPKVPSCVCMYACMCVH